MGKSVSCRIVLTLLIKYNNNRIDISVLYSICDVISVRSETRLLKPGALKRPSILETKSNHVGSMKYTDRSREEEERETTLEWRRKRLRKSERRLRQSDDVTNVRFPFIHYYFEATRRRSARGRVDVWGRPPRRLDKRPATHKHNTPPAHTSTKEYSILLELPSLIDLGNSDAT